MGVVGVEPEVFTGMEGVAFGLCLPVVQGGIERNSSKVRTWWG